MFKIILAMVMAMLCLFFKANAQQVITLTIKGRILDEKGLPMPGTTITLKGRNLQTIANNDGTFFLNKVPKGSTVIITSISYQTKEIKNIRNAELGDVIILIDNKALKEVEIVSTGYQSIPKERATGSFTTITEKTINRSVGINILDRLEGVTSGLLLNRGLPSIVGANNAKFAIRGRSTIFANAEPLIVLDGFPYEGTIDQINPADIESINVLKDAAAASIWGTRASNGVIVLTSKHGKKNQPLTIGVSSTLTIGSKPDLFYIPQISSADFIDMEQELFSKNDYAFELSNKYSVISAAVEVFNLRKRNKITAADSAAKINALKSYDIRSDLERYAYRHSAYQQYQVNLTGGNNNNRYYMSAGYDKNLGASVSDSYDRLVLNANNIYSMFKDRLELTAGVNITSASTYSKSNATAYSPYSPYDRMVDGSGNPMTSVRTGGLRSSYVDTVGNSRLLDWNYRAMDEQTPDREVRIDQYKINLGLNFKIIESLSLTGNYQYLKEINTGTSNYDVNSFYTRNLINRYSSINGSTVIRPIPLGSILNKNEINTASKIGRIQLNFNKAFSEDHEINAIVGFEGSRTTSNSNGTTLYGYDPDLMTNANNTIDPQKRYKYYYSSSTARISIAPILGEINNVTSSFYSNVSYSFKNRYILSGSVRRDESNLFGVKANLKAVPLWSAGAAYIINQESFYNVDWLPQLKLRITYGYNGNVDKTVSGYLTVLNSGVFNDWGSSYAQIINPPNPNLRWERVKTWNAGLDYALKGEKLTGSIDLYEKSAIDLIGNSLIAMQSGVTQFKGNNASLLTRGVDVIINSKNLSGKLGWRTSTLFNYNVDRVTNYNIKQSTNGAIVNSNFLNPLQGYPYYAIFAFPSAGLNASGAPQGFLNGQVSTDYSAITSSLLDPGQLKYFGSASPKYFGSIINTFNYNNLELSFNITYKLAYFFRKRDIFIGSSSKTYGSLGDSNKRWQKPGDEYTTKIPALDYLSSGLKDTFVRGSEDYVVKGDHIRMQDIKLSYVFSNSLLKKTSLKSASVYLYAKNLGILWRENSLHIDPDYGTANIPNPFSFSIGLNLNF